MGPMVGLPQSHSHLGGGQGGPPREQVDWSHPWHCGHCAGDIKGQTRAKEGRIRLSQSHCRQRSTMAEYLSQLSRKGRPRSEKSFRCKSRTRVGRHPVNWLPELVVRESHGLRAGQVPQLRRLKPGGRTGGGNSRCFAIAYTAGLTRSPLLVHPTAAP